MTIYTATTQALLLAALASAKPGDTIQLAPGSYSGDWIENIKPAGQVTITSADPANRAVFADLHVEQCSNLRFTEVVMQGQIAAAYVFKSSQIAFDRVEVRSSAAILAQSGLWIVDCLQVQAIKSEIHHVQTGGRVTRSSGITIADNYIHDIQIDGIQSTASSGLAYHNNLFTEFHPESGDHPDAIQHFTSNSTVPDRDITVSGNIVLRRNGGIPQGIFITDEAASTLINVNVADNLILGAMYNGIMAGGWVSGSLKDNIVLGLPDMDSSIRGVVPPAVIVTGNTATGYVEMTGNPPAGNVLAKVPTDGGAAALTAWVGKHAMPGFFDSAAAFLVALGLPGTTVVLGAAPSPTPVPTPTPTPVPAPSPAPAPTPKPKPVRRKIKASMVVDGATYTGTLTEKL